MAASNTPEAAEHLYIDLSVGSSEHDSESSDDSSSKALGPGPSKKARGVAVYKTKFNKDWTKEWSFICEVPNNVYEFHCTMCSRNISCAHKGKRDVERHISKTMHKANVKALHSQQKLTFLPMSNPVNEKVKI